jgi:hypothetical protein
MEFLEFWVGWMGSDDHEDSDDALCPRLGNPNRTEAL